MIAHFESAFKRNQSIFADLAALLCHGGLVVETLGESGLVAVRSTIHLDGDITVFVAQNILARESVLDSHISEVEIRIESVTQLVKKTVWTAHGILGAATSVLSLCAIRTDSLLSDVNWLMTVLAWGALNAFLFGLIAWLMRTSSIRNWLMSSIFNLLSRVYDRALS